MLRTALPHTFSRLFLFKIYLIVFYYYSQSILAELIFKDYYIPYLQIYETLYLKSAGWLESYYAARERFGV